TSSTAPSPQQPSSYGSATPSKSHQKRPNAEKFWYVVMNIAFGSGYLSKVITKKALSEVLCGDDSPESKGWQAPSSP
ncbi:hypothetical protein, partial [Streptomyces daliensis]